MTSGTVINPGATAAAERPPSLRPAIVLLVLGLVLAIPCGLVAGLHVLHASTSGPHLSVPGDATVHLSTGPYMVYEETGSTHGFGPLHVSTDHGTTIIPVNVTITGPDRHDLRVRDPGSTQTLTIDSTIYTGAARFDVPATGDYEVRIDDGTHTTAIIGRPVTSALGEVLAWIVSSGVGGLVALAGLVWLAVTSSRRRRFEREHATAPAGWYADPGDGSQWRYYDGAAWTEHTHRNAP